MTIPVAQIRRHQQGCAYGGAGRLQFLRQRCFHQALTGGECALHDEVSEFDEEAGITFNRAYYLSTAPEFFSVIRPSLESGTTALFARVRVTR